MAKKIQPADMEADVFKRLIPLIKAELYDDNTEITMDSDFRTLEMDSIDMMDMVPEIETEFGIEADVDRDYGFDSGSTVRQLVKKICEKIIQAKKINERHG